MDHVGEHVGTEYIAFVSHDDVEADLSELPLNYPTSFISYDLKKNARAVAEELNKLHLAGYLNLIIFLDDGHEDLLKIMVNEKKVFSSGVTGLCRDSDISGKDLQLRLDTKLYYYTHEDNSIVLLWETYAVNGITITDEIGTWNESFGLSVPPPNMVNIWHRRTSLHGLTVNVASINRRYLHEIYYEGNPREYRPPRHRVPGKAVIGGGGIFLEPLNILSGQLNFTLNITASIDDKWGSVDKEGVWNGMIGMVVRGEADIAAASLTRSLKRDEATSFTITLMEDTSSFATPIKTQRSLQVWVYLEIFPPIAWMIIIAVLLSISVCFCKL